MIVSTIKKLNLKERNLPVRIIAYVLVMSLLIKLLINTIPFIYSFMVILTLIFSFVVTRYFFQKWFLSLLVPIMIIVFLANDLMKPGMWFADFCKTNNAGFHIYETAENIDGYFDASSEIGCDLSCQDGLLYYGYDYVETELVEDVFKERVASVEKDLRIGNDYRKSFRYSGFANEPGLYRFYVVNSEDDLRCELFNEWMNIYFQGREKGNRVKDGMYKGICIATEKIDKIKSKYEYRYGTTTEVLNGRLSKSYNEVVSRDSGNVIAESARYSYSPDTIVYAHSQMSGGSCPENIDIFKLNEVLLQN